MVPSTFTVVGTFYEPDGVTASLGNITFTPNDEIVTSGGANIADTYVITTILAGAISQTLVVNTNGYIVQENVTGEAPITYLVPGGVGNIDLKDYRPS